MALGGTPGELPAHPLTPRVHPDLVLWADAPGAARVYGQSMRFDHAVRREARAHAWDYGLAGAMIGAALVALVTRIDVQDADAHLFRPDTWWGWATTIAVCAALAGRRRWPLRTLALGLVLVLPLELASQRDTVTFFALVIALYTVAAHLPPVLAARGIGLTAAFYAVLVASGAATLTAIPVLGPLFLVAAFALGLMIRRTRTLQQLAEQAAVQQAAAAIEATELDAADERLRMAQELHDVLAHSLSVIAVQAGIGAHLIDRQSAEASRALDAIRSTCDTAERELSHLVGILRNGAATAATTAPTITAAPALVDQIRSTDRPVTLVVDGDLTAVPPGVSLAAFRIVQEALTNVVRHAGAGAATTVAIEVSAADITVTVDDDGRGLAAQEASGGSPGNGLLGMSERARLYGGHVQSGARPGGGFRVRAVLNFRLDADAGDGSARPPDPVTIDHRPAASRRQFAPLTWDLRWDLALAGLMAAVATLEVITTDPAASGPHFTPTHLWAFSLRLASSATLAFRRRHPAIAYAVAWAFGLALTIGDYQVGVMIFVSWIGLYSVALYASTRQLIGAVIGTTLGIGIIAWSRPPDLTGAGAVWAGAFFAASAIGGYTVRRDSDRRAAGLDTQQVAAAAHARHTRLMLSSERLRIADELSSVITHSIGTVAHHAEIGSRSVATDTDAARDALQTISAISRDALNDLRRLLKHLRTNQGTMAYAPIPATDDPAPAEQLGTPR